LRQDRPVQGWSAPLRIVLLAALLPALSACRAECRNLCSDWYDYQRDFCGDFDTGDGRVQCVADYRAVVASDEELAQCESRSEQIEELRAGDDDCLCHFPPEQCLALGGDDDSGAP
jgi:hypothetical protein